MISDLSQRLRGGLVFAAWAATLCFLIASGASSLYLRPEFVWVLGCAAVIALAFLVAVLRQPVRLPISRATFLLVPLLHIAASDPGTTGADMFAKRFLGLQQMAAATAEEPQTVNATPTASMTPDRVSDEVIKSGFAGPEEDIRTAEPSVTVLNLLRTPQQYAGKTVKLLGLLHNDAKLAEHFGPGRTRALYRFVVTCCAADALPVTVALEGDVPALDPQQWIEIEGEFSLVPYNGKTVPLLSVQRATPVDAPVNPFLY